MSPLQPVNATSQPASPLGDLLDSLTSSYKQLLEATLALNVAGVPYAICGGFAISMWSLHYDLQALQQQESGGLRSLKPLTLVNTRDVDIIVRRGDIDLVQTALSRAGFTRVGESRHVGYLRNSAYQSQGSRRGRIQQVVEEGIHLLFAGEKNQDDYPFENADPSRSVSFSDAFWGSDYTFNILEVEPLLLMKLCSVSPKRPKDLVHLVELWESGAVNEELVEQVALNTGWFESDYLKRFHDKLQETICACRQHGMRRYAMIGEQVDKHFAEIVNRAVDKRRMDANEGNSK